FELILSIALYSLLCPGGPASYGRPHMLEVFVPASGFVLLSLVYGAASNRLAAFDEGISLRLFSVSLLSAAVFAILLGCVCAVGFYRENLLSRLFARLPDSIWTSAVACCATIYIALLLRHLRTFRFYPQKQFSRTSIRIVQLIWSLFAVASTSIYVAI